MSGEGWRANGTGATTSLPITSATPSSDTARSSNGSWQPDAPEGSCALLYPPQRIVVGEVRQQECLDLLIALNSGIPGMCTIHANSAREAITKMCTLPLLAGENIGSRFVVPTVAGCVDIVVHLVTEPDGSRRVREIVAVPGRVEGDVVELEPIFAVRGERLVRIDGYPPHVERFESVGIDIACVLGESAGAGTREGAA